MPAYDIYCPLHGVREVFAGYDERPLRCDLDALEVRQVFHPPYFVEDRLRLWSNRGSRFSHALGAEMPESRRERDKLAKAKGVEFCSKAELLADNREAAEAVEYRKHVSTGGKRDEPKPTPQADWKKRPKWAEGLLK